MNLILYPGYFTLTDVYIGEKAFSLALQGGIAYDVTIQGASYVPPAIFEGSDVSMRLVIYPDEGSAILDPEHIAEGAPNVQVTLQLPRS